MARNQFELDSRNIQEMGRTIAILGTGLLFTEAILGLFAIDIAIWILISREEKHSSRSDSFLTGYLLGRMSSNQYSLAGLDLLGIGLLSFSQSLVAGLILSAEFAMPIIFIGILATWLGTIAMISLGKMLETFGEAGIPAEVVPPPGYDTSPKPNDVNAGFFRGKSNNIDPFAPSAPACS